MLADEKGAATPQEEKPVKGNFSPIMGKQGGQED